MSASFPYHRRIQFAETDMAGIVHFSRYFRFMEEAEHALWRAAGLSIAEPTHGWPRVAAAFDYKRPLRFEDEFDVHLRIAEITRRTMRYACRIAQGDATIATGELTIACVRRVAGEPMKSVEIPPEIAARFQVVAEGTGDLGLGAG